MRFNADILFENGHWSVLRKDLHTSRNYASTKMRSTPTWIWLPRWFMVSKTNLLLGVIPIAIVFGIRACSGLWQKYFRWLFCIGTLVIAFKTLHAIYWAETRGYVITSTKMTLLHLTKKCNWNIWRTLSNLIYVSMGVEYMLQSGQNVLWYSYESQNS